MSRRKHCSKGPACQPVSEWHCTASEGQLGLTVHRQVMLLWILKERVRVLCPYSFYVWASLLAQTVKNLPAVRV